MRTVERATATTKEESTGLFAWLKAGLKEALRLPDSIGVLMQKYRVFALEYRSQIIRNAQARALYPLFLSQYKVGIIDYKLAARAHGWDFSGTLKHPTYPNQELRIEDGECTFVWSTVAPNDNGLSKGDRVTIVGNSDGRELYEVKYERWEDGTEIEYALITYANNGRVGRCGNYLR